MLKNKIRKDEQFAKDYKMLNYFQEEYMYRHKHFWNVAIKSFLLTISITIIPMVNEIFGISFNNLTNNFLFFFPATGGIVATVSSIILLYESERMKKVNDAKYRINKRMNERYQYVFYEKNDCYKITLARILIIFMLGFELIIILAVMFVLVKNFFI